MDDLVQKRRGVTSFLHAIGIIPCLGLVSNNQDVWEHSSLLCENAVLINLTDRAGISLGMRPANARRRYNVKTSLIFQTRYREH